MAQRKPKEHVVKDILPNGEIILMTKEEEQSWRKRTRTSRREFDKREALRLAVQMALENSDDFTEFCESQYPTQGSVLYNALRRAKNLLAKS